MFLQQKVAAANESALITKRLTFNFQLSTLLPRLKICTATNMKKKETLKELLQRLDEQSALFNSHLAEANRFFETAQKKMEQVLDRDRKDLQLTIKKLKQAVTLVAKKSRAVKKK